MLCSASIANMNECSNMSSMSGMEDITEIPTGDHYGGNGSSITKAELRKNNKPIMEKRRRARINNCLSELKALILEATKKDPSRHSKLEKADILDMTVRHLQTIQRQHLAIAVATDPTVLQKFKTGFNECANEVGQYVNRMDGVENGLRHRLMSHLNGCVKGLQQLTPMTFSAVAMPRDAELPSTLQPRSAPRPQPQHPEDVNNNNSEAGMRLIPSRLRTGEFALVVPRSSEPSVSKEVGFVPHFSKPKPTVECWSEQNNNNASHLNNIAILPPQLGNPSHSSAFKVVAKSAKLPPLPIPSHPQPPAHHTITIDSPNEAKSLNSSDSVMSTVPESTDYSSSLSSIDPTGSDSTSEDIAKHSPPLLFRLPHDAPRFNNHAFPTNMHLTESNIPNGRPTLPVLNIPNGNSASFLDANVANGRLPGRPSEHHVRHPLDYSLKRDASLPEPGASAPKQIFARKPFPLQIHNSGPDVPKIQGFNRGTHVSQMGQSERPKIVKVEPRRSETRPYKFKLSGKGHLGNDNMWRPW